MTWKGRHWNGVIVDDLWAGPLVDDHKLHLTLGDAYDTMKSGDRNFFTPQFRNNPEFHEKWDIGVSDPEILRAQREFDRMNNICIEKGLGFSLRQEEPMKTINVYEIIAVYAENPESPVVFRPKAQFAFGLDEEEAVLRSGIYMVLAAAHKEPMTEPLDPRYITVICTLIGAAKVAPSQS